LLTHGHFDHILGAGELQQATGAKILIHALDRECLTDGKANLLPQFSDTGSINLTADRLLEEGDVISFGDILLRVLHTPGHSRGSVCFISESEQLIFTGDTLFAQGFGRTDFYGSNPADMVSSLERLADLQGNYRVLPGHGPATSLNAERKYLKCFL
jgi:glyoxylase-like metal-dependent hydrolase (beta-lactamase superfamily II)